MEISSRQAVFTKLTTLIDEAVLPVRIQCGHFALNFDETEGRLFPGIYQDVADSEKRTLIQTHPYMGSFPFETWSMGVELAAYAKKTGKQVALVLLVNDWQWVPKAKPGEENQLRKNFYAHSPLPPSYLQELRKHGLSADVIAPFKYSDETSSHPYFFSETQLRNRFASQYSATCELNNQCAQEYVPLVLQLQKEGTGLFISFVPKTCLAAVETGTEKCRNDFGVPMKIVNLYANGIFKQDFWEQIDLKISV
jgi:hypothetical protein